MKRILIAAALVAALPICYAQGTPPKPAPANVISPFSGSFTGSVGQSPSSTGSSVGQTIQGTPLPPPPSTQPQPLGGTTTQPGVLGSAPPSPGVIGTPTPSSPCIGSVGMNGCSPATQ